MSLRFRLIAAISALLLLTLTLNGALACWRAYASVQTEMRGAMAGAEDVVREALGRHGDDDKPAFVADLVSSFNGQRHVRATVVLPTGGVWAQSRVMTSSEEAPAWFRRLIGVHPQSLSIGLLTPKGASLVLSTDPSNEIAEVWRQTSDAFGVLLLFCGGACVSIYLIVGHALRRFGAFDAALSQIADGRYDTALAERGPPEFARLARGFNRMAARIRDVEQRNRELREQILILQEEERAEIARDLHDEVGPYLFAIHVDAGDIPRLSRDKAGDQVIERAGSIRDAAAHIQKHVRAILRQLRPNDALEFGLQTAIGELVAFWSRRRPEVQFYVSVELAGAPIARKIETVAYRLVQESVSNAIRHGDPGHIEVTVAREAGDQLLVAVFNDGVALGPDGVGAGMGIIGMAERVKALRGRFEIDGARGGVRTCARLPLGASALADPVSAS